LGDIAAETKDGYGLVVWQGKDGTRICFLFLERGQRDEKV